MINNIQDTGTQPIGQPQAPSPIEEGGMSQEQMRANLQDLADKIDSKYQDFNSQKFATQNKLELQKREALKEAFNIMTEAGINLEDPEDVKLFLDSLKEKNPELHQIVESSLESLFSEESPVNATQEETQPTSIETGDQDNMNININENIPQSI